MLVHKTPITFSRTERLILHLLTSKAGGMFGLEMVDALKPSLKRGTIYVTLHRMESKGLVESYKEPRPSPEVGIARRMYTITEYAKTLFKSWKYPV